MVNFEVDLMDIRFCQQRVPIAYILLHIQQLAIRNKGSIFCPNIHEIGNEVFGILWDVLDRVGNDRDPGLYTSAAFDKLFYAGF